MKKITFLLGVLITLNVAVFSQSGNGHSQSTLLSYTPSNYSTPTYMMQDASATIAKNTINDQSTGIDLFVNFTFDTSGKNVFIVYTNNGSNPSKSNGNVLSCIFSNYSDPNRTFVGTITSSSFTSGNTLKYVFYISDGGLPSAWGRVAGASGYQTSWTEGDDFYSTIIKYSNSTNGGNWSQSSTWFKNSIPTSTDHVEIVSSTSGVTLDQNASIASLTINSGGSFNASDNSPRTLTISKSSSGSSTTLSNSGTWSNGVGGSTVVFSGAPSDGDAVHSISGTIAFQNITISKTGGSSNVGASFGTNSSITGTLEIGSGGYVATPPPASFYGSSAVLKFNQGSGATYDVALDDNSWSTSVVPNYITISSGTVNLNTSRVATGNLLIDGGVLSLKSDASLTIGGNFTNTVGAAGFIINSDGTNTGSVIINGSVSGNATIERYMSDSEVWRLVSSPVANQTIIDENNWTPIGNYTGGHGYDFYAYDEATATWLNQKDGANNITSFVPGKGYLVSFETANQTKTFSGALNNGDVSINVSKTGTGDYAGANLIGNPYASGIDWNLATRSLFNDEYAYVYDRVSNSGETYEGYALVNGANENAYIAAHQGFFVIKKDAGTSSFTFTNSMRKHGGTFTKSDELFEGLEFRVSNGSFYDIAFINVDESASNERDRADAMKFYSNNAHMPNLYTISADEKKLAFNTIPEINLSEAIPLCVTIPTTGNYQISIEKQGIIFENAVVYIEDLVEGVSHDLTKNGPYSFTASSGDDPARFQLHFGAVGITDRPQQAPLHAYVSNGRLYFQIDGTAILEVLDLQGRLLSQIAVEGSGLISKPFRMQAGVYVVRLTSANSRQTAKVIVK